MSFSSYAIAALVAIVISIVKYFIDSSPLEPHRWDDISSLRKPEGPLEKNDHLVKSEIINHYDTIGPEAFAVGENGLIYTGLADGRVVSLNADGEIHKTVFFIGGFVGDNCKVESRNGLDCDSSLLEECINSSLLNHRGVSDESEERCGRPLGLHYDQKSRLLYIIDAYHGLFSLNLSSGKGSHLWNTNIRAPVTPFVDIINNDAVTKPVRFANDLVLAKDGMIYITDSSWKHRRFFNRLEIMDAAPRGRLLQFNPKEKVMKTVLCGLHFPNGITLSPSGDELLLVESLRFRVLKLPLSQVFSEQNKRSFMSCDGKTLPQSVEIWADRLPGFADNIELHHSDDGGISYYLGLGTKSFHPFALLHHMFYVPPTIRALIVSLISPKRIEKLVPNYGLIVKLTGSGEIDSSFHDITGRIPFISSAVKHPQSEYTLIGSSQNPFLGRIKL